MKKDDVREWRRSLGALLTRRMQPVTQTGEKEQTFFGKRKRKNTPRLGKDRRGKTSSIGRFVNRLASGSPDAAPPPREKRAKNRKWGVLELTEHRPGRPLLTNMQEAEALRASKSDNAREGQFRNCRIREKRGAPETKSKTTASLLARTAQRKKENRVSGREEGKKEPLQEVKTSIACPLATSPPRNCSRSGVTLKAVTKGKEPRPGKPSTCGCVDPRKSIAKTKKLHDRVVARMFELPPGKGTRGKCKKPFGELSAAIPGKKAARPPDLV